MPLLLNHSIFTSFAALESYMYPLILLSSGGQVAIALRGTHVLSCIFSASARQSSDSTIQLAATKPPGTAQLESRCLPLLGQPINGLFPCLEIDRHFVQRENFAIGLVHVRWLAWCRTAKFSKVWPSLPSKPPK